MGLIIVVFILALIFAGAGIAIHFLWIVAVVLFLLWIIGFFVRGIEGGGGRRRWYGRW